MPGIQQLRQRAHLHATFELSTVCSTATAGLDGALYHHGMSNTVTCHLAEHDAT
jgi:hypothetical protein